MEFNLLLKNYSTMEKIIARYRKLFYLDLRWKKHKRLLRTMKLSLIMAKTKSLK